MSASSNKRQGWMDEFKKSASKKNLFESIEKERFLNKSELTSVENIIDIPEIDDIDIDDRLNEPPPKSAYKKELDVDILKKSNINLDTVDLTLLLEALEPEDEIEEKDECWHWTQLFTKVTAEIADEK
jgi:hypothetical protein